MEVTVGVLHMWDGMWQFFCVFKGRLIKFCTCISGAHICWMVHLLALFLMANIFILQYSLRVDHSLSVNEQSSIQRPSDTAPAMGKFRFSFLYLYLYRSHTLNFMKCRLWLVCLGRRCNITNLAANYSIQWNLQSPKCISNHSHMRKK